MGERERKVRKTGMKDKKKNRMKIRERKEEKTLGSGLRA